MVEEPPFVGDWYDPDGTGITHTCSARTDLSLGDTDIEPPAAFTDPTPHLSRIEDAHKYSPVPGRESTREAIVESWLHNERMAEPIPVDRTENGGPSVVVTPGGQAAVHHAVNSLLSEGESALLIEPHYRYHETSVRIFTQEKRVATVASSATERFQPEIDHIQDAIDAKEIGVVVLCSPGNPTGAQYDDEWLRDLADILHTRDIPVVSDEVYAFLTYGDNPHRSIATIPGMEDQTLVIGSFSKIFGISGWRLGFIRCPAPLFDPLKKVTDRVAMQATTPGQVILERALREPDPMSVADTAVSKLQKRLDVLIEPFVASDKTTVHRPGGGFYLLPSVSEPYRSHIEERGGYEMARSKLPDDVAVRAGDCLYYHLLNEADVMGVPGRKFGSAAVDTVRLAFGQTTVSELDEATIRIRRALETF